MTPAATPNPNESASPSPTEPAATGAPATVTQQATDPAPSTEPKADTTDGTAESGNDTAKPAGAPEKYEFKTPEGVNFDAAVIEAFSATAKELNLSQEAAQKVLDNVGPIMAKRQAESLQAAHDEWVGSARADKEYGGDKFDANLAIAKKALTAFGTPELTSLLRDSGLGSHPEVIRFFYRAGKRISEDTVVTGSIGVPAGKKDAASALYPTQTH